MALEVSCPACDHRASIPDQFMGREVTCPKCRMQLRAGNVQASPPLAPAPGLAPEVVPVAEVVPEVLPILRPPHPGFWWAVLWCLGILLVTQLLPAIVGAIILIVLKPGTLMDPQALLNSPEY